MNNMNKSLCFFLVAALLPLVLCHDYYLGSCPTVDPVSDFDMDKFLGRWYVIQKFSTASNCWTYDFIKNKTDGSLKIVQSRDHVALDTFGLDNNYRYTGTLDVPDNNRAGFMRVRFPLNVAGKSDYIAFSTDYDNYGAIYSCQRVLFGHRRSASILSRRPTLDQIYIDKVRNKLESFGVDSHDFSIIDHTDCKTLPSTSNLNFGVGPDTFSSSNIGNAVRGAGQAIGNGVATVVEGTGKVLNKVMGSTAVAPESHPDQDAELIRSPSL